LSGDVEADLTAILGRLRTLRPEDERPSSHYSSVRERLETYNSDPDYFDAMSPTEFEELLIEWLTSFGFEAKRPDVSIQYGVDLIAQSPDHRSMMVFE